MDNKEKLLLCKSFATGGMVKFTRKGNAQQNLPNQARSPVIEFAQENEHVIFIMCKSN